jgi:hypothetical protein
LDNVFSASADGVVTNSAQVTMADATADQGTMTHYVLYDALTGGNFLASGELKNPRPIVVDSTMIFAPGRITITLKDPE